MSKKLVTIVYEIVDDAAWSGGGNPLHYEHHGLKSVCVSAGDLASFVEEIEAHIKDDGDNIEAKYDELYMKHVLSAMPSR